MTTLDDTAQVRSVVAGLEVFSSTAPQPGPQHRALDVFIGRWIIGDIDVGGIERERARRRRSATTAARSRLATSAAATASIGRRLWR